MIPNSKVLSIWKRAWQPPDRRPPAVWVTENVPVDGGLFDLELFPWLREPLNFISNYRVWAQVLLMVTQCGKSKLLESAAAYWLSEDAGDITAYSNTNEKAETWGEQRFIPLAKSCRALAKYLPEDRHKIRKDAIHFTHAILEIIGANETNTQSISRRYIIGDEIWAWEQGILDNAIRRTSGPSFVGRRKVLLGTTAWDAESDLEKTVASSEQRVWHSECPHCHGYHAFVLSKDKQKRLPIGAPMFTLEWETNDLTQPNGQWDMQAVAKTAHLVCSTCNQKIENTTANTAWLRRKGRYQVIRNEGADTITWILNGMAIGGNEASHYNWGNLVVRFLQAQQLAKQGILATLKEVLTKDFCEPWQEEVDYSRKINPKGGYSLEPHESGVLWLPPELALQGSIRLISVDHQATDPAFYYVVRDWVLETGESQLAEAGTANAWGELEALEHRHKLKGEQRCFYIDAGHDPAEVWLACSQHQWFALRGSDKDTFSHSVTIADGTTRIIYKPYSQAIKRQPGYASGGKGRMGVYAYERMWGNLPVKDILSRLLAGRGASWGLPTNIPKGYLEHLNSEVKKKVGKDLRYVKIGERDNHFWDCECQQLVGAMVRGALQAQPDPTLPVDIEPNP